MSSSFLAAAPPASLASLSALASSPAAALETSLALGGVAASTAASALTTPAPVAANQAADPNINVSGISLNSVLTLGNLVQQTASIS